MGTTKIVWQQTRFISEHICQAGYDLTINSHTNISVIEVCVQFPEQMPFCHTKNKIRFFILCDSKILCKLEVDISLIIIAHPVIYSTLLVYSDINL